MGMPAAKMGDKVVGVDTHIFLIPSPGGPIPTPQPSPFNGTIMGNCSPNVLIENKPAATLGSTATNMPPHLPQGGPFQIPPTNLGTIIAGSATVFINNKPAARAGDTANTCNDPMGVAPVGKVVAAGTVLIG